MHREGRPVKFFLNGLLPQRNTGPTATRRPTVVNNNALKGLRACVVVLATCILGAVSALAGPMPNGQRKVSITAREQPIGAFLQNLFAAVDVPANVSPTVTGNVNGTFSGPADRVLRDVSRVYNLVSYLSLIHI